MLIFVIIAAYLSIGCFAVAMFGYESSLLYCAAVLLFWPIVLLVKVLALVIPRGKTEIDTSEFDKEFIADKCKPLTPEMEKRMERARAKGKKYE